MHVIVISHGKKMSVFSILVAGFLIACTVALMRTLNRFRRTTTTEANVLSRKHKSKCGGRKDGTYKVAIVGAGKWFAVELLFIQLKTYASLCCTITSPSVIEVHEVDAAWHLHFVLQPLLNITVAS